jgi:hypothetical protein
LQLREAQRWLASVILAPERLDERAFAAEIARVLVCPSPEAVTARLRAYAGGYPARIGEALEEAYPALKHVVGSSAFASLVTRYLPHVPEGIYNLNDVGASLPGFLANDALVREFPFGPDLARLEHAVHHAFHASDLPPLALTTFADWTLEDWSAAVLEFQPSVALVSSAWPVCDIWNARDTPIGEIDIALEGRPQHVLVGRPGGVVQCEVIEAAEAAALESMRGGATLGQAVEEIAERGGESSAVTAWFSHWVALGLVAGVRKETGGARHKERAGGRSWPKA